MNLYDYFAYLRQSHLGSALDLRIESRGQRHGDRCLATHISLLTPNPLSTTSLRFTIESNTSYQREYNPSHFAISSCKHSSRMTLGCEIESDTKVPLRVPCCVACISLSTSNPSCTTLGYPGLFDRIVPQRMEVSIEHCGQKSVNHVKVGCP
jgi:hypothetical protein